ncbi:MAG: pilus assembly protein PilN, partial [Deltaproteobacteria bacterium]
PPDSLWLNSLRFDGKKLRLDGSAKDNDTIALFMTRLRRMPRINNV